MLERPIARVIRQVNQESIARFNARFFFRRHDCVLVAGRHDRPEMPTYTANWASTRVVRIPG